MHDDAIISIAPGIIIDYIGTPLRPVEIPVRILPGLAYSTRGYGEKAAPPGLPYVRGSTRISFSMATPPLGFIYVVSAAGTITGDPTMNHGHSIIIFDFGSIAVTQTCAPAVVNFIGSTLGAIPDGTPVTITTAWDSEVPINGPYHGRFEVAGFSVATDIVVGGTTPWVNDDPPNAVVLGCVPYVDPTILPFPNPVGRYQMSRETSVF